jgi:hypothetical protein
LNRKLLILVAGVMLLGSAAAEAQESARRLGIGGFLDYNRPILGMSKRYSQAVKMGGTISYVSSARTTVEMEYQYSKFGSGKLAGKTFVWQVDKNSYASPNARSDMKLQSGMINVLVRKHAQNAFVRSKATPYLAFGTGFFHYVARDTGLVYPGQSRTPLNTAITMAPARDRRTALTVSVGAGFELFASEAFAFDLRGRYNFVLGELRPFEDWGISKAPSLNMIDIGVGLKFYFKAK